MPKDLLWTLAIVVVALAVWELFLRDLVSPLFKKA